MTLGHINVLRIKLILEHWVGYSLSQYIQVHGASEKACYIEEIASYIRPCFPTIRRPPSMNVKPLKYCLHYTESIAPVLEIYS